MSGIEGLSSFKRRVRSVTRLLRTKFPKLIKSLAQEANRMLIENTRYRSGTARSSWQATVGHPTTAEPVILPQPSSSFKPPIKRITRLAIADNKQVIVKWDLQRALYIASNLNYIVYLEEGRGNIKVANYMLSNTYIAMQRRIERAFDVLENEIVSKWG